MGRQPRVEFPGAVYHVISRGVERRNIFHEERDYDRFLKALAAVKEKFGIKIYCYVLMTNHFHLLIETPEANLSKVMHSLKLRYANYFNKKHSRSGVFFQGKYKAYVVDKDGYLLEVIRYILLNPLRARMKDYLHEYNWSSYHEYMSRGTLTDTQFALGLFSEDRHKARQLFKEHVMAGMQKDQKHWKLEMYGDFVMGKDEFIEKVKGIFRQKKAVKEVVIPRSMDDRDKAENILKAVCERYKINAEGLKGRRGSNNEARKAAMYLISTKTGLSNNAIAGYFGNVHYSTISQMRLRVEKDSRIKGRADGIWAGIEK